MLTIKTTVKNGLPCIAELTHYSPQEGPSFNDPGSPAEIEFNLRTRKGKPAPWIHTAASNDDMERIEGELIIRIKEAAYARRY